MTSATLATRPHATADLLREALAGLAPANRSLLSRAGRAVAIAAARVRLTTSAVAMLAAASTSFGVVLLAAAPASLSIGVGVTALLAVGLVLDSATAPLARLTGQGAGLRFGRVATAVALHAAVLVTAFHSLVPAELPFLLVLPIAFAVVAAASALLGLLLAAKRRRSSVAAMPVRRSPLLTVMSDNSVLVLAFLLLGAAPVFLAVYALLFVTSLAALITALPAAVRELQR